MIDPECGHGGNFGRGGDGSGFTTLAMHLPDSRGRKAAIAVLANTSMGAPPLFLVKDLLGVLKGA